MQGWGELGGGDVSSSPRHARDGGWGGRKRRHDLAETHRSSGSDITPELPGRVEELREWRRRRQPR